MRPHIEYCTQDRAPVSRHGNYSLTLKFEGIQRRVIKIIKRVKDYCYSKILGKLGLTTLLENWKRVDQIETLKIMEFQIICRDF